MSSGSTPRPSDGRPRQHPALQMQVPPERLPALPGTLSQSAPDDEGSYFPPQPPIPMKGRTSRRRTCALLTVTQTKPTAREGLVARLLVTQCFGRRNSRGVARGQEGRHERGEVGAEQDQRDLDHGHVEG